MTEISDRYRRLSTGFAAKVAAVPADAWGAPTPCEGWTARQLVGHVVDSQGLFVRLVGREMPPVPSVDDDPVAAWDAARAVVQADLDDPTRADAAFDGFFGPTTFAEAVDRFVNFDLIVHGWDLSRAAGLDDTIDPGDLDHLRAKIEGFGDAMRGPQAFGPALEPPPGADEQTTLLAFLGRRA